MLCLYMPILFCMVILTSRFTRTAGRNCESSANAVGICDRSSRTDGVVYLSGVNSFHKSCWCTVTVDVHPSSVRISQIRSSNAGQPFNTPNGCGYKLNISNINSSYEYSCTKYNNFNLTFYATIDDNVRIQLIKYQHSTSDFGICLKIVTSDSSNVSLTCNLPIPATNHTAPTNRFITTQNTSKQTYIPTTVSTSTVNIKSDDDTNPDSGSLVAIIGGSVGGASAIITVVLILCCLVIRKTTKTTNSPTSTEYVDISTIPPNITDNTIPAGDSSYINVSTVAPHISNSTNLPEDSSYINVATTKPNTTDNTYDIIIIII